MFSELCPDPKVKRYIIKQLQLYYPFLSKLVTIYLILNNYRIVKMNTGLWNTVWQDKNDKSQMITEPKTILKQKQGS